MKPGHSLALLGAALAAPFALASPQTASAQALLFEGGAMYRLDVVTMRDIPFRTVVRQQFDYSCGSAALATLLTFHYGMEVSETEVFKAMYEHGDQQKIREVGFSLLDMKRYLDKRGLAADGYRATFDQLAQAHAPAIVVVLTGTYRHFVVVKGVQNDKVLVGDPALGLRTYTRAEFSKMWNGVVFAIHTRPGLESAYNRPEEWRPWAVAPLGEALDQPSLSSFTRELPPIYQITDTISLDPIFR